MEEWLWSLRGEHSNQSAVGKMKNDMQKWLVLPPCAPQPQTLNHWCRQGLGAEAQALELRPGRGPQLAVWTQPEEAGVWQLRVHSEEARARRS